MTISKRALALRQDPSAIMTGHTICAKTPYSLSNPKGFLNFGTAENHIVNDLLIPKINMPIKILKEHIQYNQLHGIESVREIVCQFFKKNLNTGTLNPENLVIQTGVSAICESLSFAMFDQDDIILIPAPYYTGFDHDFTKRFGCKFEKIQLDSSNGFAHKISHIISHYNSCPETVKKKIKAILITHPHNPTGEILNLEFMEDLIAFCNLNKLELISDEIYALSNHNGQEHVSLYAKAREAGTKCHLLYGMAKDFALAGLKVGFYYSEDQELVEVMKNLTYFHPVSTQTQILVSSILSDEVFLKKFIPENQRRLQQIPLIIEQQLPMYSFIPTDSGLFFILDLSKHCTSFEDEKIYFEKFLNFIRINLTPGHELGLKKPGFFRVCFARPKEDILEFIVRMKKFYENEIAQKAGS